MRFSVIALCVVLAISSATIFAGEATTAKEVGFFEAVDEGLIEASIVTYSSLDARVTVRSKTKEQLRIALPETFAAVHVFQFGDDMFGDTAGTGGRRGGQGGRGGGANQSTGGGFGGGGGMGQRGGGGGFFNIAPEQVVRQNVKTVCLEHGKKEPRKHLKYEIRPLDTVTDKPEVHEICALVGSGAVNQQAAQAAAWHYNNGVSWEELAGKQYKPRIDSPRTVPYFSRQQMVYAMTLGKKIEEKIAGEKEQKKSKSGEYVSEGR